MSKVSVGDYVRLISANEYRETKYLNPKMFNLSNMETLEKYGNNVYIVNGIRWDGKVSLVVSNSGQDMGISDYAFPDFMVSLWHEDNCEKEIVMSDFENIIGAAER